MDVLCAAATSDHTLKIIPPCDADCADDGCAAATVRYIFLSSQLQSRDEVERSIMYTNPVSYSKIWDLFAEV